MLGLGGFRVGTLAKLQYRHVKDDLEKGIVPLHAPVESNITKGQYSDYDTYLGPEAVDALKAYFVERRQGSADGKIPPETIRDTSPLIHDSRSQLPKSIGEKQVSKLVRHLYHKSGILTENVNNPYGRYEVRVHSIRKGYKTQLKAQGVDGDYIDYFMGHLTDVYHDIQSKGVEFLRDKYAKARLTIKPQKTGLTPTEMLKKMVLSVGLDPDKVLNIEGAAKPHRIYATPAERENEELRLLTNAFINKVRDTSHASPNLPDP